MQLQHAELLIMGFEIPLNKRSINPIIRAGDVMKG
jgi:hypothetical protein